MSEDYHRAAPAAERPQALTLLIEALWTHAHVLAQAGRAQDALPALRRLTVLAPDRAVTWSLLGHCLEAVGDPGNDEEEAKATRAAIALDSKDADSWHNLMLVQRRRGEIREAVGSWAKLFALAKSDEMAWDSLDLRNGPDGNPSPRDPGFTWFAYGEALRASGDCATAILAYKRATSPQLVKSAYAGAWFGLGDCAFRLAQYDESVRAYTVYVRSRPGDAKGWQRLALAQGKAGRIAEVRESSSRLRGLDAKMADEIDKWLASQAK